MFPPLVTNGFYVSTTNPQEIFYCLFRHFEETKVINLSTENNLYQTAPGIKRNYWINLDYSITPSITLKTRAQFNTYQLNGSNTQGMAILQDLTWQYRKLSISGRYA
ncbi:MAG: hypothetical protein U5K54_03640 [Cytophagales bacterium]|nr:hypothetical protein [Cytophagales bacterium]